MTNQKFKVVIGDSMYVFPYTGLLAGQPGTAEMASGAQQSSVPAAGSQEDSHQPSSTTANIR